MNTIKLKGGNKPFPPEVAAVAKRIAATPIRTLPSLRQIAKALADAGYLHNGKPWSAEAVRRMLAKGEPR